MLVALGLAGSTTGCVHWSHLPEKSVALPPVGLSADSVVLDIAVLHVPQDVSDLEDSLWSQVDEQHLPNELRRRLWANGIRCALVGTQLPESLRRLLDRDEAEFQHGLEAVARRHHEGSYRPKIYSRTGKRYKIVTTPTRERMDVMTLDDGLLGGRTCEHAHCEFALRTYPQGDGSTSVLLTPEVHYGPPKRRYVGDNQVFIPVNSQETLEFQNLQIQTTLLPGQTLLLSGTPQITGLGRHFFADPESPQRPPKIVMIRLSQTQSDDLFEPASLLAPIATPTD